MVRSTNIKVVASAIILLIGLMLTVVAVGLQPSTETPSSSGIIIDFGDYETSYVQLDGDLPVSSAISVACERSGFELVMDGNDILSIDGVSSGKGGSWDIYTVDPGSTKWIKNEGLIYESVASYSAVCIGFCSDEGSPAPGVDATGHIFYGYDVPERVVSLAPSATETICFNGGLDLIVGTDSYSNYPSEVVDGRQDGSIAMVGSFTNPSFEIVLDQEPDLVVCISTQNAHLKTAEKLRQAGVDVLVLDGGESIEAVLDNIHAVGTVLGSSERSTVSIHGLQEDMSEISDIVSSYGGDKGLRVMVSLSAAKSPWVSGSETYVSDVMNLVFVENIYSDESGWIQVNAETISKYNPEVIIVTSTDFEATQADYDVLMGSLSKEWKSTDAYRNGEVYLFTGDAADCMSRAAPRVAELTELLGRTLYSAAFDDGIELPRFVGDDYVDYLTITRSDIE